MRDTAQFEFTFNLVFALPSTDADLDGITDALFQAGFDDALIGLGAPGLVGLFFRRNGEDAATVAEAAVMAALSALPEGTQLRAFLPELIPQP